MKTRKTFPFGLLLIFIVWSAVAHPPSALVIDQQRTNIYFAYWGGTWRIDSNEKLERIHANDFHWLGMDVTGNFANAQIDFPSLTPPGSRPALFAFSDYPAVFDGSGNLYFAPWSPGRIRLERMTPDGKKENFLDAAISPALARAPGRHEGGIIAIARGLTGSILVSDGASVWTVSARGSVSSFAENIGVPECANDLPQELPKPHIRGLAVSPNGDIYAAATGCRATLRISPSGKVTTILHSETPWVPCAVVEATGNIYVMEYDNPLAEWPQDGRPRIRRLSRDGKVQVLAEMEKTPRRKP